MVYLFWICVGLIFYTYIIYPLLILLFSKLSRNKAVVEPDQYPEVVMVIAAYNEESILSRKIDNCLAIVYPADKISFLFGSDGSTDHTDQILESAPPQIQSRIYPEREGKSHTLNKLIPEINSELILFSDANTLYKPDAVKNLIAHFSDPSVGGVCGKLNLINPACTSGAKGESIYWWFENKIKEAESKIDSVISANGSIFMIRRELFVGLPETITVNDDFHSTLSILRQGKRVIFEPKAIAEECSSPDMMSDFIRRIRISALNFNGLPQVFPMLHPKYGFTALALFSHKILRWSVPFLGLGLLVSNILLFRESVFFMSFLLIQGLGYFAALLGFLGDRIIKNSGPLWPFYYLFIMNFALLIGFWRSITKTQNPAWERVER
jgi:cellulose synthase/poly-beta-1,6-N-acetylglucosamine synthase-like glycosyltransferase